MTMKLFLPVGLLVALPVIAEPSAEVEDLFDALRLSDILVVMREEGIGYGADLENDMFPGEGGPGWASAVVEIYDIEEMQQDVLSGIDARLSDDAAKQLTAFFSSEPGRTIVDLEIEARRAMQDDDIEEAAEDRAVEMRKDGAARAELIGRFVSVNDLIEQNVAGALNSNFAFYRGLEDADAFEMPLTEDQMIADVWAQEPEIRDDTTQWVYGYLTLAYQPVSDADMETYIAFSESEAGQALNDAIFAAFDRVYADISYELGQRAAEFMRGQDI